MAGAIGTAKLLLPSTHHEKDGAAIDFSVANLASDEREPIGAVDVK